MDSIICTDQSKETDSQSNDSIVRVNNDSKVDTRKITCSQSPDATVLLPLGPVTPDSIKEIGALPCNFYLSPLTDLNILRKTICFDTDCKNGLSISTPQTVSNVIFDPFAPGPEDMMLAPRCKKLASKSKLNVSRRLDFCSSSDTMENKSSDVVSTSSDDEMIETLYKIILKVIISMQTTGDDDDCKTPPLAPRVNWIAEICPGAPRKQVSKSKNIDFGVCRKLEF